MAGVGGKRVRTEGVSLDWRGGGGSIQLSADPEAKKRAEEKANKAKLKGKSGTLCTNDNHCTGRLSVADVKEAGVHTSGVHCVHGHKLFVSPSIRNNSVSDRLRLLWETGIGWSKLPIHPSRYHHTICF